MHGIKWVNVSAGISKIVLTPLGYCPCSQNDVTEDTSALEYLSGGILNIVTVYLFSFYKSSHSNN